MVALSQNAHDAPLLAAALEYAARGWPVFPLLPDEKTPLIPKSRGGHGLLDATTEVAQIHSWWGRWPTANIGLATGHGLVVIDADLYKGADVSAWRLPPTLTAQTARCGEHLLYSYDDAAAPLHNVPEGRLAPGVCVRGVGGYIVAAPSTFKGQPYRWLDPHQPIAPLPERIAELIRSSRRDGREAQQTPQQPPQERAITPGADDAQHWLDWALAKTRDGMGDLVGMLLAQQLIVNNVADVEGTLSRYAAQATVNLSDPFTARDVGRWLSSAATSEIVRRGEPARSQRSQRSAPAVTERPHREQKASESAKSEPFPDEFVPEWADAVPEELAPETEDPPGEPETNEHRTDMGNARRFVAKYGASVRYVGLWGHWMTWDGRRWQHDWNGQAHRLAKATVRDIYHEAADADDDDRRDLIKWAVRSESRERLTALLAVAQSEPELARVSDDFDTQPWLLTVQNGTLDLRTGRLGPHAAAHGITRLAPVRYDPRAQCPTWLAFLDRIMAGNAELIAFLQRAVGYSLTDNTSAQVLFLLHGSGANGKSRFLEAIEGVLGDYGMSTPTSTLMAKRDNNIPNDVARLKGARFVKAIETEEGHALAESLVKQMTGGDMITARFMRGEWFDFKPTFKLWLAANHLPTIRGTDDGIWRRIRYIPFEVQIPDSEKDEELGEKLRAEYPGILAWAVRGCLDWQRNGLGYPDAVRKASEAYRARMDTIGEFLGEMTEQHPTAATSAKRLYGAYETWCEENTYTATNQTRFGRYLGDHGYRKERMRSGVEWIGVRLRAPTNEPDPEPDGLFV